MYVRILVLFILSILLGCKEDAVVEAPIQNLHFVKSSPTPVDFTIEGAASYRDLTQPNTPLVEGNSIKISEPGVYTVMARNKQKDSVLVKIFASPDPEKFLKLKDGSTYAIVARHSDADIGVDNFNSTIPEWWKSCEASKARQINVQGIRFAKSIGEHIKLWKLPVGELLTSEFCRNVQTIENMNLGTYKTSKLLTYIVYNTNHSEDAITLMKQLPVNNKIHLLIGHSRLASLRAGSAFNWNDAFIYKLEAGKEPTYVATILSKEWIDYSNLPK